MKVVFVLLLVIVLHSSALNVSAQVTYPAREETTVDGVCLSNEQSQLVREEITQDVHTILQDQVLPTLVGYSCGGTTGWHRVAFLNMSDSSQQCPDSWQLITSPKRTCGRGTTTAKSCDSVTFSTNNTEYNQVCGRAIGYQLGHPESFRGYDTDSSTLEGQYVDGLSVTHGPRWSREHVWTFAVGVTDSPSSHTYKCPCYGGPNAPPFIGNDYFCESGTASISKVYEGYTFFPDDPLWDGQGCPAGNDCCSFSNPPWFTKQLDNPTTDDIEVRLCLYESIIISGEDVPVELIELYIK